MSFPFEQLEQILLSPIFVRRYSRLRRIWLLACFPGCSRTTGDYDIKASNEPPRVHSTLCAAAAAAGSTSPTSQGGNSSNSAVTPSGQGGTHTALTNGRDADDPIHDNQSAPPGSNGGAAYSTVQHPTSGATVLGPAQQVSTDTNSYLTNGMDCDRSEPYGSPLQVVAATTNSSETSISVQSNGLSALISARPDITDPSTSLDIRRYYRSSVEAPFGSPTEIRGATNINTSDHEGHARLSRDGNVLYFTREFVDSTSAIYSTQRAENADNFPVPTPLGGLINFATTMEASWISADRSSFYWIALDPIYALYHADITKDGYGSRTSVSSINAVGPVIAPVLTDDQNTLYFGSTGKGDNATAAVQVWRATRSSTTVDFESPSPVAELRDLERHTYPQDISPNGCILYLAKSASNTSSARHLYQVMKPR